MFNEPPRPNNIYSCIENGDSDAEQIREVPYLLHEGENKLAKRVNEKQYFRIMKRRVKKGLKKFIEGSDEQDG